MYQLKLTHGDFTINTDGSYATVTGAERIKQDLTLALNEVFGSDRFHPGWGSTVTNYLGHINDQEVLGLVKAEINRVLQNYLIIQQQGVIQQSMFNVAGQFSTNDVVRSVDEIQVRQVRDAIYAACRLTTVAGETITISQRVAG